MTLRINTPAIAHQTIAGEMILINLKNGTYYSARGSAVAVLTLVERGLDTAAIVATLQAHHPADAARIEDAVTTFVDTLLREGLVCRESSAGDAPPAIAEHESASEPFDVPRLEIYTDLKDLLFLDPIHEVTDAGWLRSTP